MRILAALLLLVITACAGQRAPAQDPSARPGGAPPPQLPDSAGVPPHVLAVAISPRNEIWVGTYGRGIYVLRAGATAWERITSGDSTAISWDFINSFAFGADSAEIWYGTVGNGYGVSRDGGRTWRNWQFRQLGPEWQYVVPDGIRVHGGVVYVATADGVRWSDDGGETWHCVGGADGMKGGAAERAASCTDRVASLPTEYLLALDVTPAGELWVAHPRGVSRSSDRGRTWHDGSGEGLPARVRDVLADSAGVWALTETQLLRTWPGTDAFRAVALNVAGLDRLPGVPRALVERTSQVLLLPQQRRTSGMPQIDRRPDPASTTQVPLVLTSNGAILREGTARVAFFAAGERYRPASDLWAGTWYDALPVAGSGSGLQRVLAGEAPPLPEVADSVAQPQAPKHTWFRRPIADSGANPFIDQTYRYGSTMGGNFQQHQGVEFNNAAGTPVRAVGDGLVVFAGPAEQGANAVAIRHDRQWEGRHVFTTYYHHTSLEVKSGQRVLAGDVIARVGNTGRATNDHLHLEVHVTPSPDSLAVINPAERFPPYTVNPQLWIEPAPGTGMVAGRVLDAAGQPVPGARVYGLVVPYPTETPFSFAETYRERAHSDPAYGEHFAVGDVSPGDYLVRAEIGGRSVWRRVRVAPGMLTWVEFRP